ncbi:MAG: beta-galactosidase [Pirellulales bacterium]|nr:beta-galactosidase [Pirellulales bacterium]
MKSCPISLCNGLTRITGLILGIFPWALGVFGQEPATQQRGTWQIGTPIVTYWAGPALTDAVARQMADGGWNLVWCREAELDVAQRHGLRAQLHDGLLTPRSLDDPAQREKLDSLIDRVRDHPALYSYFIQDEPSAGQFPELGKIVAYLRQRDPAHMAYINLFPTYANNEQLGTQGAPVPAYREHLRQYLDIVKPSLISYDHYQFATDGDLDGYFLNLALIRQSALDAGVPFLNIVQACSWTPVRRVPNADEMRYLVYTTVAYGAQGISYYVYCHPGHEGGIALADGTPTPIYHALKHSNREFVAIAKELQPLVSLAIYHSGMVPPGAVALPENAPFRLDPPLSPIEYQPPERVRGALLGYFGASGQPSHVVVVNLDYKALIELVLVGPGNLDLFDATTGTWSPAGGQRAELQLPPGGGKLLRLSQ